MTRLLYGATTLGGIPSGTVADIEDFLPKHAAQDLAAAMKAGLTNNINVLLGTPTP